MTGAHVQCTHLATFKIAVHSVPTCCQLGWIAGTGEVVFACKSGPSQVFLTSQVPPCAAAAALPTCPPPTLQERG